MGVAAQVRADGTAPSEHYDWRFLESLQRFTERIQRSLVRLERVAKKQTPLEADRKIDGVGVVVAPGRLLSTAAWLDGVDRAEVVYRGRRVGSARVLRRDARAGLVLLALEVEAGLDLLPVQGVQVAPRGRPMEVALPGAVGVEGATAVNRGALIYEGGTLYLSGIVRNGVPAFDEAVRIVALAVRPTPGRERSVAVDAATIAPFLEGAGIRFPHAAH